MTHALRELIANNSDEGGTLERLDLDGEDFAQAVVFTTNKIMPIEAFLMGYSVKTSDHPIGQFGEGLKIAMLILERENHYVEFFAGPHQYLFSFETPAGFGVETLHVEQVEIPERVDQTNTVIIVHDISQELLDAIYTDKPVGSAFEGKGLYCQGLLVESGFNVTVLRNNRFISYGVNLNEALSGNRDRNYYGNKEKIVPVLEKYLQPEDFLDVSTSWYNSYLFKYMSDEFAQRFCKAFVNKNRTTPLDLSDVRVILTNHYDSNTRYGKKDGYYIGPYNTYADYLWRNDDREVLDSLEINVGMDTLSEDTSKLTRKLSLKRIYYLHKELSASKTIPEMMESLVAYIPMLKEDRETLVTRLVDVALHIALGAELPEFSYVDTLDDDDVRLLASVVKEVKHDDADTLDEDEED